MSGLPSSPFPTPPPEDLDAKEAARQRLRMAGALLNSDDFKWFLAECIGAKITEQSEIALDAAKPEEECKLARQLRQKLIEIRDWTEQQRNAAVNQA